MTPKSSHVAIQWRKEIRDDETLEHGEKLMAFVLSTYMNSDGACANLDPRKRPSVATLAKGCGCKKDTAYRWLYGLARKRKLEMRTGKGEPNTYFAIARGCTAERDIPENRVAPAEGVPFDESRVSRFADEGVPFDGLSSPAERDTNSKNSIEQSVNSTDAETDLSENLFEDEPGEHDPLKQLVDSLADADARTEATFRVQYGKLPEGAYHAVREAVGAANGVRSPSAVAYYLLGQYAALGYLRPFVDATA